VALGLDDDRIVEIDKPKSSRFPTVPADRLTEWGSSRKSRDFAWGLFAQLFASATNFALTLVAGRLLGPSGLGIIVIGFGAYQLVAGLERAFVMQPLVASAAPSPGAERNWLARAGFTVVASSGLLATALVLVIAVIAGGRIERGLVIFAPWIVGVLLQEYWKIILFQEGRGAPAAASDCARLVAMAAFVPVAVVVPFDSVVVAVWGFAALLGLAVANVWLTLRPEPLVPAFRAWHEHAWELGRWLGARELLYQLLSYATVLILAFVLGTTDLGGLRSAEALFSPSSLVAAALVLPALPALARAVAVSRRKAVDLALRIAAAALLFAFVYMIIMVALGPWLLVHLFGSSFSAFRVLVWPIAAAQVLNVMGVSFTLLLTAQRRGRASLAAGLAASLASIVFASTFAVLYGVQGAAWGMAVGSGVGTAAVIFLALVSTPRVLRLKPEATAKGRL
jgi:O-antigen/teichoic acid export membrane protein